jgi:hypothetical protein
MVLFLLTQQADKDCHSNPTPFEQRESAETGSLELGRFGKMRRRSNQWPPAEEEQYFMAIHIPAAHIQPIAAIVAGVLILVRPQWLNFILAAYLILIGVRGLGLFR